MASDDWWGAHLLGRGPADAPWATMGTPVSRGLLRTGVAESAALLKRHGITAGSTVAVVLPPGITLLETILAVWSRGAQLHLLDARSTDAEIAGLLARCEPEHLVTAAGPARGQAGPVREHPLDVVRRPTGRPAEDGEVRLVQFSSGSTGVPKVIGRTARSILAELDRYSALAGMPEHGERVLLLNSLIHTMGLIGGFLHGLQRGTHLLLPTRPGMAAVAALLGDTGGGGAHAVLGVPLHFDLLSRDRGTAGSTAHLRLAVSAGEPLPPPVQERFTGRYGVSVSPVYGTTETGVIAAQLHGQCPPPGVGRTTGLPVRVRDGQIEVALDRTPYLRDDGRERYADGWLRTFDRGELDPATGALKVLGRSDSIVTVGGMKIDLLEVEAVLRSCPGVDEAVVVFGDAIEAHTGGTARPHDLALWARERLAAFKIPKHYFTATALPRNANGKILRDRALLHERGQL
ncbi:class I adenylate-forming enzyme family protein [Streptomyces sp. NPDC059982]|uniref:class I adenylate-forming enzyme family protein n=1 Tax=unclassified Streptomyces TaxID=2593676 RepID=UPI003693C4F5